MRFAYIITAYNNFVLLQELISQLDDDRNDIFIHFDKKVQSVPELKTEHSLLFILEKRIDVRWGTVSQIDSYYELYREAHKHGPYNFYHLISGTTLPLKSQDYIHSYFAPNDGSSIFRLWPVDEGDADFKIRRIHFGINNFQSRKKWLKYLVQHAWTLNMFIQKKLGIRINKKEKLIKTDSWASLSQEAIEFLLQNEKEIKKHYRYSLAGDEYYHISELKKNSTMKIVDDPYLLFVEFELDHPRSLTPKDYLNLIDSKYIFARKFDDGIVEYVKRL